VRTAVAVALVTVLAACSSSSHAVTPSSPATTTSPATATGPCTHALAGVGTTRALSLAIDGHARVVRVHLPTRDSGRVALPLVLNLHGSDSNALQQEALSGMDATADQDTFLAVYPQALLPAGIGFDWNVPDVPLRGGKAVPPDAADDVSFLTHLVTELESRYCIDPRRVYATGFSGGARMASQLGCDASTVFAAIAPVTGLRFPTPCNATRAVPVVTFHGTADRTDPYAGNGEAYWTYSVVDAATRWAVKDGCTGAPTTSRPAGSVTFTLYARCADGATVGLYTIAGEGHEWPGGPKLPRAVTRLLGAQSDAINADDVMWQFFRLRVLP